MHKILVLCIWFFRQLSGFDMDTQRRFFCFQYIRIRYPLKPTQKTNLKPDNPIIKAAYDEEKESCK